MANGDNKIKQISQLTNLSESTIKRALGNYSGINPKTKQRVIDAANSLNYRVRIKDADIGVIIPDVPTYFWGEIKKNIMERAKGVSLEFKYFHFSDINNEKDALNCIDTAEKSGILALIICAPNTERLRKRLTELANKILVILLEEYLEVPNTCFVGEASYNEGYKLANLYFDKYRDKKSVLVITNSNNSSKRRVDGFCDAVLDRGNILITKLSINADGLENAKVAPVARQLQEYMDKIDCIYCPIGNLKTIDSALEKLNGKNSIDIMGFDGGFDGSKPIKTENIKLAVEQNVQAQAQLAVDTAIGYIKNKTTVRSNLYVESKLSVGGAD